MKFKFIGRPRMIQMVLADGDIVEASHDRAIPKLMRSPYFRQVEEKPKKAVKKAVKPKVMTDGSNESGNSQ